MELLFQLHFLTSHATRHFGRGQHLHDRRGVGVDLPGEFLREPRHRSRLRGRLQLPAPHAQLPRRHGFRTALLSIFTSITKAPSSTCLRAILSASSYFFSLIKRRNLRDPATLHRSPTLIKFISGVCSNSSNPESHSLSGVVAGI